MESVMVRVRWIFLGVLLFSWPAYSQPNEIQKIEQEWRSEVSRLDREIDRLKHHYRLSKQRSEQIRQDASWVHFQDYSRYRFLLQQAEDEDERASQIRTQAEGNIQQRNTLLKQAGQPVRKEQTPW